MITLTPAYGRDYKFAKDVKADWESNKDFIIHRHSGRTTYFNKQSWQEDKELADLPVFVRFNYLRRKTQVA